MKSFLILTLICCFQNFAFGQEKTTRSLRNFERLDVRGAFEVYLQQGSSNAVDIQARGVSIDEIVTDVRGKTLYIELEKNNYGRAKRSIIYVTYTELNRIDWSGAGELHTHSPVVTEQLTLEIHGAGKTVLDLKVRNLLVNMSGAGKVELSGSAETQRITMSGVGSFDGTALRSQTAHVEHSGVGSVRVNASQELEANASGIGSILYTGHPKIISRDSGFLSRVKPL